MELQIIVSFGYILIIPIILANFELAHPYGYVLITGHLQQINSLFVNASHIVGKVKRIVSVLRHLIDVIEFVHSENNPINMKF